MVNGVSFYSRQIAGWLAAYGFRLEDVVLEEDRYQRSLSLPGPLAPCVYFTIQGERCE